MPFDCGSTSPMTALAAIAASTALPPRSSTWTPARAASGWLAATIPYFVATRDRPAITLMRLILAVRGVRLQTDPRAVTLRPIHEGERRDRKARRGCHAA